MVSLLKPIGHCFGVLNAIKIAKEVKEKYIDKSIYVFGLLVHNEIVTKELEELGIKTIEFNKDNAIEKLKKFTSNDAVIFSAHGHPYAYEKILKDNNVMFFDATCSKVKDCFDIIKASKEVIYIGKDNHPETLAALTMNNNAHLYDIKSKFDYQKVNTVNPLVINQTTLSFLELKDIHEEIKNQLPRASINDEICNATLLRQKAISSLDDNVDLIVVVGSKKSSNTMKLYEIAKEKHINKKVLLVNNVDELKECKLEFANAVIASGTSTPMTEIEKVKEYLEGLENERK